MQLMKRRLWMFLSILVVGALLVGLSIALTRQPRVNILLITLDTTRADRIGCYEYKPAETPHLDALARRGVLFERAYAPAPLTLPSHASMLTGLWPPEHGLITNGRNGLEGDIPTVASLLSAQGYTNGAFLSAFVLNRKFGLNRGFHYYDDDLSTATFTRDELHRYRDGQQVVESATKWLTARQTQSPQSPFFCWVHLYDPHEPYVEHEDVFGKRFSDRLYDGEIAYTDRLIGQLFAALNKLGVTENTYILVVGDHGESLGEHGEVTHGYMLHDSTLRVPLIIADPRSKTHGVRISSPVPLVDVFPTLLAAGGVNVPADNTARSLLPVPASQPLSPRPCYSQTDEPYFQAFWSPLRSLTTDRWRYVRTTQPELYDLTVDPKELDNLADRQPEVVRQLEADLTALEKTFRPRSGMNLGMSPQERRALESLGYTGGKSDDSKPVGKNPTLLDIKQMMPRLNQLNEATELIELQKFDAAAVLLEPLAREVPNLIRANINLGLCRLTQKNYDDGVRWLNQALKIDPECSPAHELLGFAYLKLRKLDLAEKHLISLLESQPDSEQGHLYLGEVHQRRGHDQLAMQEYEFVLTINPRNALAQQALAALRQKTGQP